MRVVIRRCTRQPSKRHNRSAILADLPRDAIEAIGYSIAWYISQNVLSRLGSRDRHRPSKHVYLTHSSRRRGPLANGGGASLVVQAQGGVSQSRNRSAYSRTVRQH